MRISSCFLCKYFSGLFLIAEYFVPSCRDSFLLSATETQSTPMSFFSVNYNTREAETQIPFIVHTRFWFQYNSEYYLL
jgi:hypothetical protein